jgi:hypothetical protein
MLRGYKKYIVIDRPLTGGKILYKQEDDGLHKMNTNSNQATWSYWDEYSRFRRTWIDEAINPKSTEYEEDTVVYSFDRLGDAIKFISESEIKKPSES